MWNELVGQYLASADGSELLKQLQDKGLSEQQATQAVTATAASALGTGVTSTANTIAQVVAQKTGLALSTAQTVVSMVLPKVMSLFSGAQAGAPRAPSATGGILGMLR